MSESFVEQSESITELAKAVLGFQKSAISVKKTATNPFFNSKYANLTTIIEAVRKPLTENGLSVTQFPVSSGVTTVLMHTSGEWMRGFCPMPAQKEGPQAIGSSISYARRYSLMSVLGLPAEDDDANGATVQAEPDENMYERAVFLADKFTDADKKSKAMDYIKTNASNAATLKACIARLEQSIKLQEETTNAK